jgi:hypothetical protein
MVFTTQTPVSKQLLLEKVSELDIFRLFCKDFKYVNRKFKSPILVGGKPNLGQEAAVLLWNNKRIILHDFRLGRSFTAINFAMLMTGLNFIDTIQWLAKKFNVVKGDTEKISQAPIETEILERVAIPARIDVKYETWTEASLNYWLNYGWLPYMLDEACIYPIEKFWVSYEGDKRKEYSRPKIGPFSFTYDFFKVDAVFRRKVYSPLTANKDLKWKNNTNKGIIQALNTIKGHIDTLYLVSSMKDCGPFWTVLGHPCAVAPNSESTILFPDQIKMLKQISNHQIIWYDNDTTGISNAQQQAKLYGFEAKWNPIGTPKDQSDYTKERGLKEFKKLITNE